MKDTGISSWQIAVIGIAAYLILAVVTSLFMKRPVTTELILIVGWLTMTAAELNVFYNANVLTKAAAAGMLIISIVMATVSMLCYLAYYNLDPVKGYYDGMAPFVMVMLMSIAMLFAIR